MSVVKNLESNKRQVNYILPHWLE